MHLSTPPAQKTQPCTPAPGDCWSMADSDFGLTAKTQSKQRPSWSTYTRVFFCWFFFLFVCLFFSVDKQTALRICGFHIRRCGGPAMGLEHAQILVSPACPGTSPWRHQGVNLLVRLLLLSTGCWIWRAEPGDSPQTFLQGLRS